VRAVANAARHLQAVRAEAIAIRGGGLRDLYRTLDLPGKHALRAAHEELDSAVRSAYGVEKEDEELNFLIELNALVSRKIKEGKDVQRPGIPTFVEDAESFISNHCYSG
jgi:hypothetical protein